MINLEKKMNINNAEIINMTPHSVVIIDNDKEWKNIPASGSIIRLSQSTEVIGNINGINISRTVFGEPIGLPKYKKGVYYIVSQLIKSALPNRTDLLVPAEVVRDKEGNIIGCKSLGI